MCRYIQSIPVNRNLENENFTEPLLSKQEFGKFGRHVSIDIYRLKLIAMHRWGRAGHSHSAHPTDFCHSCCVKLSSLLDRGYEIELGAESIVDVLSLQLPSSAYQQ